MACRCRVHGHARSVCIVAVGCGMCYMHTNTAGQPRSTQPRAEVSSTSGEALAVLQRSSFTVSSGASRGNDGRHPHDGRDDWSQGGGACVRAGRIPNQSKRPPPSQSEFRDYCPGLQHWPSGGANHTACWWPRMPCATKKRCYEQRGGRGGGGLEYS